MSEKESKRSHDRKGIQRAGRAVWLPAGYSDNQQLGEVGRVLS